MAQTAGDLCQERQWEGIPARAEGCQELSSAFGRSHQEKKHPLPKDHWNYPFGSWKERPEQATMQRNERKPLLKPLDKRVWPWQKGVTLTKDQKLQEVLAKDFLGKSCKRSWQKTFLAKVARGLDKRLSWQKTSLTKGFRHGYFFKEGTPWQKVAAQRPVTMTELFLEKVAAGWCAGCGLGGPQMFFCCNYFFVLLGEHVFLGPPPVCYMLLLLPAAFEPKIVCVFFVKECSLTKGEKHSWPTEPPTWSWQKTGWYLDER